MKLIPLTKGYFAKIDDEDFERIGQFKWQILKSPRTNRIYARRRFTIGFKSRITISMHSLIFGHSEFDIDHIDGDGLNNQKSNLRKATRSQNNMNAKTKKHSTKFKGVSLSTKSGTFRSRIQVGSKCVNLGHFKTPEEAARVYDYHALKHFGEYARTNQQMGVLIEI